MLRRTNFGTLIDDLGTSSEDEKAIDYIVECAKSVGIEIIPGETALSIGFIAEVLKRVKAQEPKTEWIAVKWHNITEEEREREGYPKEWLTILDCQMPNDGEEVHVTVKDRDGNPYVETDTCYFDGSVYSSDSGYDWIDDVVAWSPFPEPYKAESEIEDKEC